MMNTPFYFMSMTILFTSSLMAISSSNWMYVWAGMELNLLSFIPIMLMSHTNQESEASIKYFLAQALGSSLMLVTSMSLWLEMSQTTKPFTIILMLSIMLKLGAAPCHTWYPSVMSSISWMACLILSTWQKVGPLMIVSFMLNNPHQIILMIMAGLNSMIGGSIGMNQTHLRSIMAYSSITHMGWMLALMSMNKMIMSTMYFVFYSLLITPIFMLFNKLSSSFNMNMNNIMKSTTMKLILPTMILSLGGLPPLTGFIPKWMTIIYMANINPYLLLALIMGSMMNLFFYLNLSFSLIMSPVMVNNNTTKFLGGSSMITMTVSMLAMSTIPSILLI